MTQPGGETDQYSASAAPGAIIKHSHQDILNACLVNTFEVPLELPVVMSCKDLFPWLRISKKLRPWRSKQLALIFWVSMIMFGMILKLTKELILLIERTGWSSGKFRIFILSGSKDRNIKIMPHVEKEIVVGVSKVFMLGRPRFCSDCGKYDSR